MYQHPHQFEPLLPSEFAAKSLREKAHALQKIALECGGVRSADDNGGAQASLAPLLRAMNSYYTNRIEGQHTLPAELERAIKKDYSAVPDVQRRQRLALAHMHTEAWAETTLGADVLPDRMAPLYAPATVCALHQHLFAQLQPAADTDLAWQPGALRARDVTVGQHLAPAHGSVPAFLVRWQEVYGAVRAGEMAIIAAAASHHRLAWIHPFEDGNGRVARLHTHTLLHAQGLTRGLWSPLRGFARTQATYYAKLAGADAPRAGDLDGRGNLSERGLIAFIDYFLDMCIDQARFMSTLLDAAKIRERIAACLHFEVQQHGGGMRVEALYPLHYVFLSGPLERGIFKSMTGLGDRTADSLLRALLKRGLLESDSPKGKVRFGTPLHALRFYFPSLWPEAEMDSAT